MLKNFFYSSLKVEQNKSVFFFPFFHASLMFASKARAHPMAHLSVPQFKGVGSFSTNITCQDETFIDKHSSLFSSIVIDE